ncbi:MAG: hypothetical protein FVQ82_06030 [Planctomycetes bacterium]|nr:hypothetical protein [Planctomycetota bacterium]
MTNVNRLLESLALVVKPEGSQLRVDCLECDDTKKHLYIEQVDGLGHCKKCGWSPNPYKLIEKMTTKRPVEIMKMLDELGLTENNSNKQLAISGQQSAKSEEKKLALSKADIRKLTADEIENFCSIKSIETDAIRKFTPFAHTSKPWLLLPAFSPNNTKAACGWLRCRLDGKPIDLGGGNLVKYPIVKNSKHGLFGVKWLLEENPEKIIFCEAWRDALAAISIGLHAVASSGGASKWDDNWLPLFACKKVYICMDADKAGQKALLRAAKKIATVATDVFIVTLSYEIKESHGKDLHDYIVADGHGKDFLLLLSKAEKYEAAFSSNVDDKNGQRQIFLRNNHALTVGQALHRDLSGKGKIMRHYNYQCAWCEYTGTGYKLCEYVDMQNIVWRFATKCLVPGKKKDSGPVSLNCSEHAIKNALSAMGSFKGVDIETSIAAPAWLDGKAGPDPEYVIALSNGLLDVTDEPDLLSHTPDFLNFNLLSYGYDASAECPEWIRFLGQVFGKVQLSIADTVYDAELDDIVEVEETVPDDEKIMCLQEWFGLLLTKEMKYHKMLGVIGPKRSGKGTISRVLTELIGSDNVAAPTFTSLVENFGLQGLLNARVAIFGDASMDKDPVIVGRAIEKLKTISGCDGIDVNRKYEPIIQGARLGVRFVMISNNLQRLTDPTGTVSDRFIFLKTTQSFYGSEDLGLEKRLLAELSGILNWSLEGLRRLKERGHIFEPAESIEMRTQSKELGSNVIAFVNIACNKGEGMYTMPDEMYDAFKRWCEEDGSKPMKKRAFRQEFTEAFSQHACSKHRVGSNINPIAVYWEIEPCPAYTYG